LTRSDVSKSEFLEDDLIDSRIGVHDSDHVEVKLDYAIEGNRSRYFVDTFLFVPASLGITAHTYKAEQFYSDIQAYIRFKTPNISLARMIDLKDRDSPLSQISSLVVEARAHSRDVAVRQRLSHQLRLFGCLARAKVRDRSEAIQRLLTKLSSPTSFCSNDVPLDDADQLWQRLLDDMEAVGRAWRGLRADFIDGSLGQPIRETYEHVDEYVSLVTEIGLSSLISVYDASVAKARRSCEARRRAVSLILAEREYRRSARYRAVVEEKNNDHLLYHRGLLKKLVTSVLWLEVSKSTEGKRIADIGASIAAAVAMLFAVVATIKTTHWWGVNTTAFVVAAVITYIFKDRIKDWIKLLWGARVSSWLADYNVTIRDPVTQESIGKLRESFSYLRLDDVPHEIVRCRHAHSKVSVETMAKPEVVLKYSKAVVLDGKKIIDRLQLNDSSLHDILRISLRHFLSRADDPKSEIPYYFEKSDAVKRRRFRKVYHLNLVIAMRAESLKARPTIKRVRVVFDKNAIRQLREIS
jgi:hypothetical protein